jgi:hypothetical protein
MDELIRAPLSSYPCEIGRLCPGLESNRRDRAHKLPVSSKSGPISRPTSLTHQLGLPVDPRARVPHISLLLRDRPTALRSGQHRFHWNHGGTAPDAWSPVIVSRGIRAHETGLGAPCLAPFARRGDFDFCLRARIFCDREPSAEIPSDLCEGSHCAQFTLIGNEAAFVFAYASKSVQTFSSPQTSFPSSKNSLSSSSVSMKLSL